MVTDSERGHLLKIRSTGDEREKCQLPGAVLPLKEGSSGVIPRSGEGLKIDSILGICIQWHESCVCGVQCLPMPDIYYSETGVYVSATGEQAPGFFYCQRECELPSGAAC